MANYFERVNMAKQRNSYIPQKQNQQSGRDSIISGYSSKKIEKSPIKQNTRKSINVNPSNIKMKMKENTDSGNRTGKRNQKGLESTKGKRRYKDAVQQLHEKIMKLKI